MKNDSITQSSKKNKYAELLARKEGESSSVIELLDARIDAIEERLAVTGVAGTVEEILLQYALVKLNYAGYVMCNTVKGEFEISISKYEQAYDSAAHVYANLI